MLTKTFSIATKNLVNGTLLKQVAIEVSKGLFEANLGGHVLKKRIATKGRGKSGSIRVIVVFKKGHHCFFVYGFEKNEKDNITINEEKAFKIIAKKLLNYSDMELNKKIIEGKLLEINGE